ncbi:MAG TPA: HepT-like ribonuclease domain-containing protein [Pararhizobium sp.]|nr:HepT-like ribonuclease domain-containing protein [Pararhizobium sp.]
MSSSLSPTLVDVLVGLQESCRRVERVTSVTSREKLRTDEITQLAMTKAVEQIGETCNRILLKFPDFVAANPDLALKEAAAMRHRLVHGYDTIEFDTLWDTATVSVPDMHNRVAAILDRVGEDRC